MQIGTAEREWPNKADYCILTPGERIFSRSEGFVAALNWTLVVVVTKQPNLT